MRADSHSQRVHDQLIGSQQFDLGQVQADEIKARTQGGSWWMAMAVMVSTRLWLGGVVGPTRDRALSSALVAQVRTVALCRPLLLTFDGLPGYVSAFRKVFRSPLPTGKVGRPRLVSWPDVTMAQVIKRKTDGVLTVERRIVQGGQALVERLIRTSQGGGGINTSYIDRLNTTFRARLFVLVRRSRALARTGQTLVHGRYLTAAVYNFCTDHKCLRQVLYVADGRRVKRRWVRRTPAMAAGLSHYRWTVLELMTYKLPPPQPRPPPRRSPGRRSPALQASS